MNRRSKWRAHVYLTTAVDAEVRILLLRLLENMDHLGKVSVPRTTLARELGVDTATITRWVRRAHEAGLLDTVSRGRPGSTAEYQGLLPGLVREHAAKRTKRVTSNTAAPRVREHAAKRTNVPPSLGARTSVNVRRQSRAPVLHGGLLTAVHSGHNNRTVLTVVPHALVGCAA